jgi:hypothetical protein
MPGLHIELKLECLSEDGPIETIIACRPRDSNWNALIKVPARHAGDVGPICSPPENTPTHTQGQCSWDHLRIHKGENGTRHTKTQK